MRKRRNRAGQPFWGCPNFPQCRGYRPCLEDSPKGQRIEHPSPYQRDVFDWIQYGSGNAVVEAVAGSGKTSTMVHAATLFPTRADSIFLAFNKHIADELSVRLPAHAPSHTMHSICFKAIRRWKEVKVNEQKSGKIVKDLLNALPDTPPPSDLSVLVRGLCRMASLAKSVLIDPKDQNQVLKLLADYNIAFEKFSMSENVSASSEASAKLQEQAVELLPDVLTACAEQQDEIDFDDMIWFVLAHDLPIQQYDWVVVDEAQDLNNLQMAVLKRMLKPGGRCVAVGDRHQSIYGFRGANTQAIPLLIQTLGAKVLPLNVCYRCPTRHLELARELVPQIEAAEKAIPGAVEHYMYSEVKQQLKSGNLVLCRMNSPLVQLCFELIRRGTKATIKGRDIGKSLIDLIEAMNARTLAELQDRLTTYKNIETVKLIAKDQEMAAQALGDRCDAILAICERGDLTAVGDVVGFIRSLFDDNTTEGVICSSVHKAKGLEAETVYILYPHLMPSKHAKTPEELQQERNIRYVALTRSKSFLGFIEQD